MYLRAGVMMLENMARYIAALIQKKGGVAPATDARRVERQNR
jgi:hypothetical protein